MVNLGRPGSEYTLVFRSAGMIMILAGRVMVLCVSHADVRGHIFPPRTKCIHLNVFAYSVSQEVVNNSRPCHSVPFV